MKTIGILICALCCLIAVCGNVWSEEAGNRLQFSADTSRPELSTFIPGEKVILTFSVSGLNAEDAGLKLRLRIVDESDKAIASSEIPVAADSNGKWTGTLDAPNGKLGFYRVYATLSNGVSLPKLRSRPAGYLTYCIVPDPAKRVLYPSTETFFGMQGGFCPTVKVLPYLGIRWVLGGYTWGAAEPDKSGQYAESRKAARTKGEVMPGPSDFRWCTFTRNGKSEPWTVYMLPCLYLGVPKWASIPETAAYSTAALTPEGEKGWRNYCLEVGKALTEDAPNLKEHLAQITWEPVYPWGYKGTDEQLVRIHEIAYKALHEADPKVKVLGPTGAGISKNDVEWNLRLMKAGLGKYIDGLAIHPYHAVPPEREGYINHVRALKEGLLQTAGHPVKIYGTEQGKATNEDMSLEIGQALGLIRENLIFFGEGAQLNFSFYVVDYPGEPGYGFYYNLNPKMDWGTDKTAPKPVAPAYAAMSYILEGHKSAGAIEWLGDTAWGYAFERGDDIVLAVWDFGDTPRPVSISTGVKQVTVYDWMGNAEVIKTQGGIVKVSLTQKPLYIKGVSPSLWSAKAQKPLVMKTARITGFAGTSVKISGTAAAVFGKAFNGSAVIEPDKTLGAKKISVPVRMKAGGKQLFSIDIPVPANAKPGIYTLGVSLVDKTGAIAASGIVLTISPPVTISDVHPVLVTSEKTNVLVTVQNEQNLAYNGNMQLSINGVPESRQSVDVNISAKGKKEITFSYKDLVIYPERTYTALVKVTSSSGNSSEKAFTVDFLNAVRMPKTPVIDGDLSDWAGIPVVTLKGKEFCVRSKEYFDPGLNAKLRYSWDKSALYIAAEVEDRTFIQEYDGFMTWKGDCLQLAFNMDPGKTEETTGNVLADTGTVKRRICEIDFALTKKGPEAFRTSTFDIKKFPVDLLTKQQLQLAVTRQGDMTVYEAAIPWGTLGLTGTPASGEFIGTAITVNDMNDIKQLDPAALGLFGGIAGTKNPDKYGTLLLQ